jgi:acetyl-CoA acyltransferase
MNEAFICDAIRTPDRPLRRRPEGRARRRPRRHAAARTDEAQSRRATGTQVDDVIYGCANQAGEDNRNVARMSALLAGLPQEVPGTTVNRLCGSGMDASASPRARSSRRDPA